MLALGLAPTGFVSDAPFFAARLNSMRGANYATSADVILMVVATAIPPATCSSSSAESSSLDASGRGKFMTRGGWLPADFSWNLMTAPWVRARLGLIFLMAAVPSLKASLRNSGSAAERFITSNTASLNSFPPTSIVLIHPPVKDLYTFYR